MNTSCLIIDDEPLARKRLCTLVEKIPELTLLGQCSTGKEAIKNIETLKPDLIFLDIQMKDMNGFDVLKNLNSEKKPVVIFVTAFDEYALKAFDYFAFDYLLKPFKKERFIQSVARVIQQIKGNARPVFDEKIDRLLDYIATTKGDRVNNTNKIPIKTGNAVSFINVQSIKYILASGSYIDIHTDEKIYVHRSSLQNLLKGIAGNELIRIHRSTVVNINFIDKVIHSNFGEMDVKMKDENVFRISKSYRKDFQKTLGI